VSSLQGDVVSDNDINLEEQHRKQLAIEPFDGKGTRGGGNHPMSGEPLFNCPSFGLVAHSYCYSCHNFNGSKKTRKGDWGECDPHPGAREHPHAQIAREQPLHLIPLDAGGRLSPRQLNRIGVRSIQDDINAGTGELVHNIAPPFNPRPLNTYDKEKLARKLTTKQIRSNKEMAKMED